MFFKRLQICQILWRIKSSCISSTCWEWYVLHNNCRVQDNIESEKHVVTQLFVSAIMSSANSSDCTHPLFLQTLDRSPQEMCAWEVLGLQMAKVCETLIKISPPLFCQWPLFVNINMVIKILLLILSRALRTSLFLLFPYVLFRYYCVVRLVLQKPKELIRARLERS